MVQSCFKIKFDITDYADVIPDPPENIEDIINWDKPIEECVWKKVVPKEITPQYIEQEITRVLRTGVWIYIKDHLVWIPPSYYFFLQYFKVAGGDAEFRLKRLKNVYFKIRVRNNKRAIGTYTIKNRQDGETTFAMAEALWECAIGNMNYGSIAMQSKTRDTVINSCWRVFTAGYRSLPMWIKDILFSDIVSKDKISEKIKFSTEADETKGEDGRDILVTYGAAVHNAFDSMNNMRRCILDEINKWLECSFYDTFLNYQQFIAPGLSRKGIFDIFSSPSDVAGEHNKEALEFWKGSNPNELNEFGTTNTRVFRYYSNPLDGVENFYDKYGDSDPDEIYKWIMMRRKSLPKEKVMGEIRAYPLNEEEMFGSFDGGAVWSNVQGVKDRLVFLIGNKYKDEATKEPIKIYGNLERVGGYIDGDVVFRQSDKDHFDLSDARFCFTKLPDERYKEPLNNIYKPPRYIEGCIGLDPFNNRYEAKNKVRQSNGAMVHRKFRDIHGTGFLNVPTAIYLNRPHHIDIFFEDALMFAIYTRSLIQVESKSDRFASFAEDRGYSDWLIDEIGSTDGKRKGDAPSGGGNRFLNTGIALIDSNLNLPAKEGDPYYLKEHWFSELLEDYLKFNPLDTHENDLVMADIQSLVGCIKLSYKKVRQISDINKEVINFLLN